jgi:hypothetical protein
VAKIKVSRVELIRVVDGRLRKLEAANARAKEAYPAKLAKWREDAAAQLEKEAERLRNGKPPPKYYRVDLLAIPPAPDGYRERCNLERTLKTLKIGTDEGIVLSPDDADYYFGPCETKL